MRGGLGGIPIPLGLGAGLGLPGILLVLALFLLPQLCSGSGGGGFGGINSPFNQLPQAQPGSGEPLPGAPDPDAEMVDFVSFVLDDVQTFWANEFAATNEAYEEAELVLFTGSTQSGCGIGEAAMGPFYCSLDSTAYLDLEFFGELNRLGAPGDFAQAYVIAHELAHHVQNITGISSNVRQQSEENPDQTNELSIAQELQADCLAGVWGYSTYERGILEPGDVEEALTAAAAIGDDRIQRGATGSTNPETWTHGSSEQRLTWFRRGFDSGDASNCNTFDELD